MGNTKAKTIDEFFIEKYKELEKENAILKRDNEALIKNCRFYREMIINIKKDFEIKLREYGSEAKYITFNGSVWDNTEEEKFNEYLSFFNLETQIEKGEEDNEQ